MSNAPTTGRIAGRTRGRAAALLRSCALAAIAVAAVPLTAAAYPTQPVRIVVPFGAGGPADIYARYVGQKLSEALGQPFVIENRPGGGAVIGTEEVVRADADGHTLLMMSNTHTTNETLMPDKSYRLMEDLVPVAPVNYSDLLMVVSSELGVSTLDEFLALAKDRPGELNYASSGPGTPYHMAGELFKAMAGVEIEHVPHRGSGEARASVLGGHVDMMLDAITTMRPNVETGSVVALGVTGEDRSALMPDTPTVSEGGVEGYTATIWLGLMAPAGTPQEIVDQINAEVRAILQDETVVAEWAEQGAVPLVMTAAEFAEYMQDDIEKWAEVVEISGAALD